MSLQYGRIPCPGRIVDDMGGGFALGCASGFIMYFFKGIMNSPKGEKISGGIKHMARRAPILGGSFAAWGGVYSSVDCMLLAIRKKEDPINPIIAGAITGGTLAFRSGMINAAKNAVIGGCLLGLLELSGLMMYYLQMKKQEKMLKEMKRMQEEERMLAKQRPVDPSWAANSKMQQSSHNY